MSDGEKDFSNRKELDSLQSQIDKLEASHQQDREKRHTLEKALVKTDVLLENLTKAIQDLVTRGEFTPVKLIVFGLAATILSSAVAAMMAGVISK